MRVTGRAIRGRKQTTLVDIGCGDGSFLLEARRQGWTVLGTELDLKIVSPDLDILGSIEALRGRAPFGCITLWHSLEHFRDPVAALADLAGMLTADGVCVVAVPNSGGWQARLFKRHWLHLDVPRHLYHFSLPGLRVMFDRAGLDVVLVRHQEVEYDVFGWIQSTLNCIMPRPNILFHAVTGQPCRTAPGLVAANLIVGCLLLIPAVCATALSALVGRGGTIVMVAQRRV
jgi:hypothetical protein